MGFGKEVALKIIDPDASLGDEPMVSLANEARLGCLLHHPNIVSIDEFDTVDGAFYIAMEYIEGWPLERLIRTQRSRRKEPIPLPVVVHILIAVCDALDYAHQLEDRDGSPLGIVHRDLKPGNIMISRRGEVKVADFGTAKSATNVKVTQVGYTRGTPAYMSPEQVAGKPVDGRSDVFALGALMHEVATGEMAFDGENIITVMKQVMEADVREIRDRIGSVAPALEPLLKRCMQQDPAARYQAASTIAGELRRLLPHIAANPTIVEWLNELEPELPVAQTGEFGWDPLLANRGASIPAPPTPDTSLAPYSGDPSASLYAGPDSVYDLNGESSYDLLGESNYEPAGDSSYDLTGGYDQVAESDYDLTGGYDQAAESDYDLTSDYDRAAESSYDLTGDHPPAADPTHDPIARTLSQPNVPSMNGRRDESDFLPGQMTPDHEIRAVSLLEADAGKLREFAPGQPLVSSPGAPQARPPAAPISRPPPSVQRSSVPGQQRSAPALPPVRSRPRSTPGRPAPPRPLPPRTASGPRKNVARRARRASAVQIVGIVVRLVVLYLVVLFAGPGIPGKSGETIAAVRDWQVGLITGSPAPKPWLERESVVVGDDSFVAIAAATIRLGRGNMRGPRIEVPAFKIMAHELTVDEYRTGCPKTWWQLGCPEWNGATEGQTGSHPAVRLTWERASAWCSSQGWRLPTEAEWALAARGPKGRTWPWGDKKHPGATNHEFSILEGTPNDGFDKTAPVGSFPKGATPEGVQDLSGNVAEWTLDCWLEDLRKKDSWKPYAEGDCNTRTVRGGSWKDMLEHQTALRRSQARPALPSEKIGMRCVQGEAFEAAPEDPEPAG